MEIRTKTTQGATVLELKGKLIGNTDANTFRMSLREQLSKNVSKVVIDLEELEWLNSSGLGLLVEAAIKMRQAAGDIKLARANERVKNIFAITKLEQMFEIFSTVDDAIAAFDK